MEGRKREVIVLFFLFEILLRGVYLIYKIGKSEYREEVSGWGITGVIYFFIYEYL